MVGLLGWWNLLKWWRRPNKFGNLVPKKNLMFFSTVVTSKSEIAGDTPVFWFYHFILLDAFHHVSAITWDKVFGHWIHLRRTRIKAWEPEGFHALPFCRTVNKTNRVVHIVKALEEVTIPYIIFGGLFKKRNNTSASSDDSLILVKQDNIPCNLGKADVAVVESMH